MARTLLSLVVAALLPVVAFAATAPTTPTYVLKWGNNGAAPAQFNQPSGVATDALGNVYITDQSNHRVQKFDTLGNFITQWGSFGTENGQFNQPFGIAIDGTGTVYVVDNTNNRVQKFSASGAYVGQWGALGAGNGLFNQPLGIAVDAAGNVFVADRTNNRVQKFTSAGVFVTKWGTPGSGNGQFNIPTSVATDAAGNVYVTDNLNNRMQKFTNSGVYITQWGSLGAGNGQFNSPIGVAVDGAGNVYVADLGNQRIQKFTSTGTYLTRWGSVGSGNGQFNNPLALGVDAAGNVYVADQLNHRVQEFSSAGEALGEPAPAYQLQWSYTLPAGIAVGAGGVYTALDVGLSRYSPTGVFIGNGSTAQAIRDLATDAAGNVFVSQQTGFGNVKFTSSLAFVAGFGSGGEGIGAGADGSVYVADGLNTIRKYTNAGALVTQWGAAGSGDGQFNGVWDVAADPAGNVYTVETSNDRVQKFTSTGVYISQWGAFGAGNGQFNTPRRVTTDASGNVYVTDTGNNRIQKFTGAGVYISQWGSAGAGGGTFSAPKGVAVDDAGNLYVADYGNHLIQKFTSPASIAFVSDVRNDQGRQVRLRVKRASGDSPGSGITIPRYDVFRRIDALPGPVSASPTGTQLAGWDQVGTFSAYGESEYNVVMPTLADATAASLEFSTFMVRAATSDPFTFRDSGPASSFSVDNLSPSTPAPFQGAFAAGVTQLTWGPSAANDFETFRLHRGASADFVPGPGNLIATTTDVAYPDAGPSGGYYKLTAVDWNGNESAYALVGPGQTTDAPNAPAIAFALDGARPTPASGGRVLVHFALTTDEPAALELIDVTGRRVKTRAVGSLGAGRHVIDMAEGERIGSGVYFLRLTQGANERVVRTSVVN